jgi:hypothetical protein
MGVGNPGQIYRKRQSAAVAIFDRVFIDRPRGRLVSIRSRTFADYAVQPSKLLLLGFYSKPMVALIIGILEQLRSGCVVS